MKLEEQVCSLDLARRLKELGVKQEGILWWTYSIHDGWTLIGAAHTLKPLGNDSPNRYEPDITAFTVAELGEMLPTYFGSIARSVDWFCGNFLGNRWHPNDEESQRAGTEANARAKMLIYLIEQGVIKP